jgi:hypothetical protein
MSKRIDKAVAEALSGGFGFDPDESAAHFMIQIPRAGTQPVQASDHLSWEPERIAVAAHFNADRSDGQIRCRLARAKWNEIADPVRAEFNARLKRDGQRTGRWKAGFNPIARLLGKELVLLMWAIEDADPATIPVAVANWQGLTPEERWWLYTMTAAATGNAIADRGRGWRKALRFALTENPVTGRYVEERVVPEYFRLVSDAPLSADEPATRESDDPDAAEGESPQVVAPRVRRGGGSARRGSGKAIVRKSARRSSMP